LWHPIFFLTTTNNSSLWMDVKGMKEKGFKLWEWGEVQGKER
jgi:hypothetical protein